jgi:hypothetical protein
MQHHVSDILGGIPELKTPGKKIYITTVMDVMGSLVNRNINGNTYLMDDNFGLSCHQGTNKLQTSAQEGDVLIWVAGAGQMEIETNLTLNSITGAITDAITLKYVKILNLWVGTVNKGAEGLFEYELNYEVQTVPMTLTSKPTLLIKPTSEPCGDTK